MDFKRLKSCIESWGRLQLCGVIGLAPAVVFAAVGTTVQLGCESYWVERYRVEEDTIIAASRAILLFFEQHNRLPDSWSELEESDGMVTMANVLHINGARMQSMLDIEFKFEYCGSDGSEEDKVRALVRLRRRPIGATVKHCEALIDAYFGEVISATKRHCEGLDL